MRMRHWSWLLGCALAAAAAVSCGSDEEDDGGGSPAGAAGEDGTGGSTSTGGSTGDTGGTTGTGGETGQAGGGAAGQAGSAGAMAGSAGVAGSVAGAAGQIGAGAGGQAGNAGVAGAGGQCTPAGDGTAPAAEFDACLKAASCFPAANEAFLQVCVDRAMGGRAPGFDEKPSVGAGVDWMWSLSRVLLDEAETNAACVNNATSCDDVLQCLNGGSPSGACTGSYFTSIAAEGHSCDSGTDVINYCVHTDGDFSGGQMIKHDCAAEGMDCIEPAGGGALCGIVSDSTECPAPGFGTSGCNGNVAYACITEAVKYELDCANHPYLDQAICGDTDPGGQPAYGCVANSGACTFGTDDRYCDGTTLVECDETRGQWGRIDCTALGDNVTCEPTGNTCFFDPTAVTCGMGTAAYCDCDAVVYCDWATGEMTRLECPDYGFSTCNPAVSTWSDVCLP